MLLYDEEPKEKLVLLEGPKYWLPKDEIVRPGVMRETKPVSLSTLCGKYLVVWQDEDESPGERTAASKWRDTVTLERRKSARQRDPDPDGFKGVLQLEHFFGYFHELSATYVRGKQVPNQWELIASDISSPDLPVESLTMEVTNVVDDSGHHFVNFHVDQAYYTSNWLGKKQTKPNVDELLTDAERERLGMRLTAADVEKRAKEGKMGRRGAKRKAKGDDKEPRKKCKEEIIAVGSLLASSSRTIIPSDALAAPLTKDAAP
ncbi:hypothetical protein SCP_1401780 [Sparassis crispa]|uniref:Uncharacterized protein n=1 Tax=Sparassis crispa TaxID=139825 RepID=A0A401H2Z5_9APHY|nr:hypothetical protein SCP_1401780 [Sparassis crispa]GBE88773.1 hypothetical protein SCP_1401780 [Sparassis crispa]